MNIGFRQFLQGFGAGNLFSNRPRPGAATQVFATEDVPCDEEVQQLCDTFIQENALAEQQVYEARPEIFDAIFTESPAEFADAIKAELRQPATYAEVDAAVSGNQATYEEFKRKAAALFRQTPELSSSELRRRLLFPQVGARPHHPALLMHMVTMETMMAQVLDRTLSPQEHTRLEKALRRLATSLGISVSEVGLTPSHQELLDTLTEGKSELYLYGRKPHHDVKS